MKNKPETKKGRILNHLQDGRPLTQLTALRLYGAMRLASTINRLRDEGFLIRTNMQHSLHGESYAEYSMIM